MAAAAKINPLILSALFLFSIILSFPATTISDNPCAYPCYPPPTGTGGTFTPTTPTTTTPSPPSSQTVSYPPPAVVNNPTGNYPYNRPPSTYNGGYGYGANPPPDPILPYFPFYYKNGARGNQDASSATSVSRRSSTLFNTIATTNLYVVFVYFFFNFL
ncbi:mucin-2-like [Pyrus x bretschneideri]|uniref:mucin-2-like n=1 Tax=Pyrus x bretschneideri TaxID=225117 RepID=UPI00202E8B96|nr:mucin-2-like [Pyrus x bretschneideri]